VRPTKDRTKKGQFITIPEKHFAEHRENACGAPRLFYGIVFHGFFPEIAEKKTHEQKSLKKVLKNR
jgi:hypothetical protein